ncbi:secreted protein [Coccidioides immitis H538.4]|uniref:Secreted protein n=2 Tax=Coccidioides immitis TaxID=5501 RepID=A0A0J8S182_COCIT|nr:secreted protein [Coccidioides immitis RMSCC 2394]KMU90947.1 secreted protein [Coccidioides immitis H538.4]
MFFSAVLPLLLSAAPLCASAPASALTPPNIPSASAARAALAELTVAPQGPQDGYSRDLFPHWITVSGECNTRETVLRRDGTDVTIDDNCYPTQGNWYSPYDGGRWDQASDVDIDHVVPLSNAWKSGAREWTTERRRQFANDLENPQLIAVTDNVNQEKGDKGPEDWKPPLAQKRAHWKRCWGDARGAEELTCSVESLKSYTKVIWAQICLSKEIGLGRLVC